MSWNVLQKKIQPYLIRIETQQGSRTGFGFDFNSGRGIAAIATAAHVIDRAHEWKQSIGANRRRNWRSRVRDRRAASRLPESRS